MAHIPKTIVATGCTSGLGFELVKQLLGQVQPYKIVLGARDTKAAQAAYAALDYDKRRHSLTVIPVELSDLKTVKSFAEETIEIVGQDPINYLLLNAAIARHADDRAGPQGSQWCDSYIINHLSQHCLTHMLRSKLETSHSRIAVVSSGAIRGVTDTSTLDDDVKAGSQTERSLYSATKFIQLLGAHWWRRELQGRCTVVAVSPGLIPGTGLGRFSKPGDPLPSPSHPDAKSISVGAQSIMEALTRNDIPADPEQIFLTSWGEWWPKDVYGLSLNRELQDKWCPSKEEIEQAENVLS